MPIGRKSVLTDGVIDKICEARSIGATYEIAAAYAKVSEPSLMGWIRIGEELQKRIEAGEEFIQTEHEANILIFLRKIAIAENTDDMNLLSVIDKAAAADPSWAEKRLRWKHRKDFNLPVSVEHSGEDGGPIVHEVIFTDGLSDGRQNRESDNSAPSGPNQSPQ